MNKKAAKRRTKRRRVHAKGIRPLSFVPARPLRNRDQRVFDEAVVVAKALHTEVESLERRNKRASERCIYLGARLEVLLDVLADVYPLIDQPLVRPSWRHGDVVEDSWVRWGRNVVTVARLPKLRFKPRSRGERMLDQVMEGTEWMIQMEMYRRDRAA